MTEVKPRLYRRGELKTTLSEGEKNCLRLVLEGLSSKQIALKLNLSPHTIDARLKTSMAYFQTDSRMAAAKRLSDLENTSNGQNLVYQRRPRLVHQAADVATLDDPSSDAGVSNRGLERPPYVSNTPPKIAQVSDAGAAYANNEFVETLPGHTPNNYRARLWERDNQLTIKQRFLAMFAIAGLAIFAFGFFVNSVGALSRLLAS